MAACWYLIALLSAYVVTHNLLLRIGEYKNTKLVIRVGSIVGIVSVLPASFLAVVVGGNIGGAIGAGAGNIGLFIGVSIGVFLVTLAGIVLPSILSGYLAGRLT
ncbi:MAG: hypothetical protein OEZ01_16365 [Candidatus Heimdallarchaeota archaeon]|nr:hypothetical protein [Candidatus Heimdallarchaeota archaeon]